MSCDCDRVPAVETPTNLPGLPWVRRQPSSFGGIRRAMLRDAALQPGLAAWRAHDDDLGLMLVEMWAYAADVVSFYDEVIGNEAYLRTAQRRPAVGRLVDLIGYRPRPAVGAQVRLALLADGVAPIALPAGTGFRSGAFDDEAPQVFESGADAAAYGRTSRWSLAAPAVTTLDVASPTTLRLAPDASVSRGDVLLVRYAEADATTFARVAAAVTEVAAANGAEGYVDLALDAPVALGVAHPVAASLDVRRAAQRGGLWTMGAIGGNPAVIAGEGGAGLVILDGLYRQIRAGQHVVLERGADRRWFRVTAIRETSMEVTAAGSFDVDGTAVTTPPATTPVTRLVLDTTVNDAARRGGHGAWDDGDAGSIVLHYALIGVGDVRAAPRDGVGAGDVLTVSGGTTPPADGHLPTAFLARDVDERALAFDGTADLDAGTITPDGDTAWGDGLRLPVTVYGNVVAATRGETVAAETLGSGDAGQASQSFALAKHPLTYLAAPSSDNPDGLASTLQVRVEGILWSEVESFYGAGPDDEVYIVRHDDDGVASVTFGDGVRGARLPSGTGNVTATYRHGAGAAAPPAGSITQMVRAVKGISGVLQPLDAYGGADAESADEVRDVAPRTALTLGRAVSLADLEAVAASVPGVRAVAVDWRWNRRRQRPVAQIAYIGDAGLESTLVASLRAVAEPTLPVEADRAEPLAATLGIEVAVDPRYVDDDVLAAVAEALLDEDEGLLVPERIGIGRPLFRSRVIEAVLSVDGAIAVTAITWQAAGEAATTPWTGPARDPGAGAYFDFEEGAIALSAQEATA